MRNIITNRNTRKKVRNKYQKWFDMACTGGRKCVLQTLKDKRTILG